jgi:hypothetical protein
MPSRPVAKSQSKPSTRAFTGAEAAADKAEKRSKIASNNPRTTLRAATLGSDGEGQLAGGSRGYYYNPGFDDP